MKTVTGIVKAWDGKGFGSLKPDDPELFEYTQYILFNTSTFHHSGRLAKMKDIKIGDRISVEIIAWAHRVFETDPEG